MHKEFLMGNAAIALGAVAAGVNVVAGYPGTPSTEVLETVAKYRLTKHSFPVHPILPFSQFSHHPKTKAVPKT